MIDLRVQTVREMLCTVLDLCKSAEGTPPMIDIHLFTPIFSSGERCDPQFQVNWQLRSPSSQFPAQKAQNKLKIAAKLEAQIKDYPNLFNGSWGPNINSKLAQNSGQN